MGEKRDLSRLKTILLRPTILIGHIPFTVCMVIILLVVAWWTNSTFQELTRTWMSQLGFAPHDFWLFRWERLFLSALVTSGGITFWLALMMVAFTSGVAERLTGTWRAVTVFWGVHLVTLMLEALLFTLPLHRLGFTEARGIFFSRDVGPSAGYMGSLGYITSFLPKPWRMVAFGIILVYLAVSFFIPANPGTSPAIELSDDMAHIIAFPLGWLLASQVGKKSWNKGGIMSEKTIAQKLSLKPGTKFILVNPPPGYQARIGELPAGVKLLDEASSPAEAIQVFIANRGELEAQLPQLKQHMTPHGMLWVSYHKGTSKVKTDINRDSINAYARTLGFQGVAIISVDDDWAALRLKLVDE